MQIILSALPKRYDPFVPSVMCQDQLANFEHMCGKLLEETRREENHSQHEALLITKARKKYFGTYYKGSRMATSKRRPNAKRQPHESTRRIKDNDERKLQQVVANGATSSENAHLKTGRDTLTIGLGS